MNRLVRTPAALLLAGVLAAGLAGCTGNTNTKVNEVSANASGNTTAGDSKSSTDTSAKKSSTTTSKSGTATVPSIPGGDNIPSIPSIPGGGKYQKCVELATAYASLFTSLQTNPSDAEIKKVNDQLDKIKAEVPDNIKNDIQTLEDGLSSAGSSQTKLAEFFGSSEFTNANQEILDYLTTQCSLGG